MFSYLGLQSYPYHLMCWFLLAAIKYYHKLGGLTQQKLIPSQFWRLKVWNQGVSRNLFPLKDLGKYPPFLLPSFWWFPAILHLASRKLYVSCITLGSASINTWPFLCASVHLCWSWLRISHQFSFKDTTPWILDLS